MSPSPITDIDASSGSEQLPSVEEAKMMHAFQGGASVSSKVSDVETAFTGSDGEHDQLPSVDDVRMNSPRRNYRVRYFLAVALMVIVAVVAVTLAVVTTKASTQGDDEVPWTSAASDNSNYNGNSDPTAIPLPDVFTTFPPADTTTTTPPETTTTTTAPAPTEPVTATTTTDAPATAETTPAEGTRYDQIVQLLTTAGVSTMEDLQQVGSPQQRAVEWIADVDPTPVALDSVDELVQQYAVTVFYYATGGIGWPNNLNFLSAGGVCNWFINGFASDHTTSIKYGVTCSKEGNVQALHIPSNFLTGKLPAELGFLRNLERFEVFNNPGLTGGFPTFLKGMPNVNYVGLHYCGITGTLPAWLGSLPSLQSLVLSNNNLSGEIPSSVSDLTNLQNLYLDDNNLEGNIAFLSGMTKLTNIVVEDNRFEGVLDDALVQNWEHLFVLDVSHNRIQSSIPSSLFALPKLRILDLHGNDLTGPIPEFKVSNNTALEILTLNENELTGSVPSSLGQCTNLKQLDISRNKLQSTLPTQIGNLDKTLEFLYTAENSFKAEPIPSFLARLTALKELSLKNNQLVDAIPDWFGGMSSLILLDLADNRLTGTIPASIGDAHALTYLLLQQNELEGSIPESFSSLDKLSFFMVDKNKISGSAQPVCGHPENVKVFTADCKGDAAEVECPCCTECCENGDTGCNDKVWLGDSNPIWELDYQRYGPVEFDASAARTYTVQFGGEIP